MIAVFFALSQEIACLKSKVNILKKMRYAHATFYQSEFCGFPLTLVQTGIGRNVSDIIQHLSKCFRIQLMVSSGFAGSINPAAGVGDLVIGKQVLYSSQESLEGEIKIDSMLSCDASIVNLAVKLCSNEAFKSHCGDILTVNEIIRQSSLKKHAGSQTSAIAVDMESFAIAERAHAMGIPFVVARAISDGIDEDLEIHENMVTEGGNVNIPATARHLLNKPHHIPYLNRLRKQTKSATDTLSAFFPNFITQIYNSLLT
ncbi:MAG TPA: phosphorylase family protein [Candidatus Wunengus sp. YC60]|uniref:phosphorylase family protein n=1 Tax=Candidatus Wunengus sp. YC60 TaxID=3367697 RepID=UPI00402998F7